MKICNKCLLEKSLIDFNKRNDSKDGYRNECKECRYKLSFIKNSLRNKEYYKRNHDELLKKSKERKYKNRNLEGKRIKLKILSENISENEKICSKCLSIRFKNEFTTDNNKKDKLCSHCNYCKNIYFSKRKKNDILFLLKGRLRSSLSKFLRKNKINKNNKTEEILGCSFDAFRIYLENKFENWMTIENYGKYNGNFKYGWDIDHIIPLSSANNEE